MAVHCHRAVPTPPFYPRARPRAPSKCIPTRRPGSSYDQPRWSVSSRGSKRMSRRPTASVGWRRRSYRSWTSSSWRPGPASWTTGRRPNLHTHHRRPPPPPLLLTLLSALTGGGRGGGQRGLRRLGGGCGGRSAQVRRRRRSTHNLTALAPRMDLFQVALAPGMDLFQVSLRFSIAE